MQTGIYAILNILNNKIYIGQASNIQKRWKNHRIMLQYDKHHSAYLQNAYNKYTKFAFIWYVIEECNKEILTEREQYWMDFYKSYDREFGYNSTPVAGGSLVGYKHKEETKQAWSKQRIGKKREGAALEALRAGAEKRKLTYVISDETRKRQSDAHKDVKLSVEHRKSLSASKIGNTINNGRKQSIAVVLNRTAKLIGQKRTPEQIANIMEGKRKAARRREKDLMWTW